MEVDDYITTSQQQLPCNLDAVKLIRTGWREYRYNSYLNTRYWPFQWIDSSSNITKHLGDCSQDHPSNWAVMLLPREELDRLAVMDPDIADYLAKNPRPPVDLTDYTAMRLDMKAMEDAFNAGAIPLVSPEAEVYHEIPMRDGFMSSLKVHKPIDAQPGPLVVLAFGGGFIGGSVDQLTRIARALVKLFDATVVSISYRLAPEYKFPTAQYDAWDSMKWIAEYASDKLLDSDPKKGFIMGGVSAGGALTASLSRLFQEVPLAQPLTGQWLSIPSIMDSTCVPEKYKDFYISANQQADGPFLSKKVRETFKKITERDSSSPLGYAVNSKTPLSGQPPTYFQVDGKRLRSVE